MQAAESGGFRGCGGIGGYSWLVSSCVLAARKTVLAKEIVSEDSGFGWFGQFGSKFLSWFRIENDYVCI